MVHAPRTVAGVVAMQAAEAALTIDGHGGVGVDLAGALALADAAHVSRDEVAPLIVAAKQGVLAGVHKRRKEAKP